jgi:hypothetical protein
LTGDTRPRGAPGPSTAAARLAAEIERRGLTAPAALLIDAHRPIAPLVAAGSTLLAPLLAAIAPAAARDPMAVLEDADGLDDLLAALEAATADSPEPCRTSGT